MDPKQTTLDLLDAIKNQEREIARELTLALKQSLAGYLATRLAAGFTTSHGCLPAINLASRPASLLTGIHLAAQSAGFQS